MPPAADPIMVNRLVAILHDPGNAEPASMFPQDKGAATQPGLYAWWVDEEGIAALAGQLEISLPSLIYAGLAGATKWPTGIESTATLWSRVHTLHLHGNIRGSTFRQTLAAVLAEPLALHIVGPNRLTRESEGQLSVWMADHLRVTIQPYADRDTLGAMEQAILTQLDPPLNLKSMASSAVRKTVADWRRQLAHPM